MYSDGDADLLLLGLGGVCGSQAAGIVTRM